LTSGIVHLVAAFFAIFGLPYLSPVPRDMPPPIAVELVTIADITTPPPPKRQKAPPTPVPDPKPEPPQPKPEPDPPKPPEAKPEPPPEPEPPKPPEPPTPEPPPPPKEAVEPLPEPAPAPVPKPKPTPPKKEPPKKQQVNLDDIASLLDKRRAKSAPEASEVDDPKPNRSTERNVNNQPLTMSEIDAARIQIEKCWNPPVGAPNPEQLVVRIRVSYNPDGTLAGQPQLPDRDGIMRSGNVFLQRAAESVVRAVLRCQPLKLPQDKYDSWRDIEMTFNPKDMLGG
jgi:hypothetical protein